MLKDTDATIRSSGVMSPVRWKKLEEIYTAALPMNQSDRRAFLERAGTGDSALRQEAESLLAADEAAGGFLQDSASTLVIHLMVEEDTRREVMSSEKMTPDGHYEILEELGDGGMGKVYKARDTHVPDRLVVIKVLKEEWLKNEWVVSRFKQEAAALARVDDSGVVGILDAGAMSNGQPYLVIQYVEGSDLSRSLQEASSGMDFAEAAEIMKQVGRTLTVAHEAAVIHRDLKPGNIMVRRNKSGDLQVKVIDFGIAKVKDAASKSIPATAFVVGTPHYMSPEQIDGKLVTHTSDIYALGVIAYEMLTGRHPFNSENLEHLRELKKSEVKVKPGALRPGLTKAAESTILKALSPDPTKRQQSARKFGDELAQALTLQPPSPASNKRWLFVIAVAVVIIAVTVGILWSGLLDHTVKSADMVSSRTEGNQPFAGTASPVNEKIYDTEYSFPTGPPPKGMVYASIGFTVYRMRPATARDGEDTAREIIDGEESAAERIDDYITNGDRLYLGIESLTGDFMPDKGGYLYVINREQYADGSFGRARLIFPTLHTYDGNNRVKPGQPIVLPRAKGEPFRVNRSRADQVAETFVIILSPWAFQLPQALGEKAMVLPDDLIAGWQTQYGERMYRARLRGALGETRTRREQDIGRREIIDAAESLTQNESLPQTCYRRAVPGGNPVMLTVDLRFKD